MASFRGSDACIMTNLGPRLGFAPLVYWFTTTPGWCIAAIITFLMFYFIEYIRLNFVFSISKQFFYHWCLMLTWYVVRQILCTLTILFINLCVKYRNHSSCFVNKMLNVIVQGVVGNKRSVRFESKSPPRWSEFISVSFRDES